jgi:hypothetical protein
MYLKHKKGKKKINKNVFVLVRGYFSNVAKIITFDLLPGLLLSLTCTIGFY